MTDLERLSFTIEKPLLRKLAALQRKAGVRNRSEFLRDLIRGRLVETEWESDLEALGTITLIYDHHMRHLGEKLTDIQHHHDEVLATTHVHLDRHLCAEMIMVKGRATMIRALADSLGKEKGVLHSSLSMSSTGRALR